MYFQNGTNQVALRTRIKTLECPSAFDGSSAERGGIGIYYGTMGIDWTPANNAWANTHLAFAGTIAPELGKTNYLGVAGDWRYGDGYRGILVYGGRLQVVHISDGSSNTLLFGEVAGGRFGDTTSNNYYAYSWGCTSNFTAFGLSTGPTDLFGGSMFGSRHTNLVNFVFGDGSVRPLLSPERYNGTDFAVLAAMAGRADGQVIQFE
jgi:prepilin-type processing-associated H-X9-DG protein